MPNKKITRSGIGCVIIMILLALAVVYPLINNAIGSSPTVFLKYKGRNIWLAISAANTEQDLLGKPMLWPTDLEAYLGKPFESAEAYFTFLISDGESGKIEHDPEKRIVYDLKPSILMGPGLIAATGPNLPPNANAWHVVCVGEKSLVETPFLITRNVKASEIRYPSKAELDGWLDATHVLPMNKKIKPFGNKRAVWITRGGNAFDARQKYLTRARVVPVAQPEGEAELRVLPSIGGYP